MFNILEEFCIFASSFYDGCIIFIKRADHIRHVKTIIDKFAKFGIQIIFKKCQFVEEEVYFLGYVITKNGIKPQNFRISDAFKYFRVDTIFRNGFIF